MCLGVPGKVVSVEDNIATVDFWGVHREVRLDIVDEPVATGDYVLNHVGFAIRRIPDSEVAATMALYDELLAIADKEDLLVQDVQSELRANDRSDRQSARAETEQSTESTNGGTSSHPTRSMSSKDGFSHER
jgi:hydrogenase expression/formation protein HypC